MTTMHTMLWNNEVHFLLVAHAHQTVWSNRKGPFLWLPDMDLVLEHPVVLQFTV